MIKRVMSKLIVFDKEKYFKNLNNWDLVDDTEWCGLDYEGEGSRYYDFSLFYKVGDIEVDVWVEVHHTWSEEHCVGDYDTPPSSEICNEHTEIYISQIHRDGVDVDMDTITDLVYRLEFYILDTVIS